jgi:hypothetical protein
MKRFAISTLLLFSVPILILAAFGVLSGPEAVAAGWAPNLTPSPTPIVNNISLQVSQWDDDTSVPMDTNDNRNRWNYIRLGTSATKDVKYINGLRFQHVSIPPDSRIIEAKLSLYYGGWTRDVPVHLKIQAENSDSAQSFADDQPLVSQRPLTSALVDWTITESPPAASWFQSPDIAEVLQMVVNRPGWHSGNSLAVIIRSTDTTEVNHYLDALSYDLRPDIAPKLEIVYETHVPVPTSTPTLTPTPTVTPTPEPGRLAIEKALPLPCNVSISGDTREWDNNVETYAACHPEWPETGPEAVYRIDLDYDNTDVHVQVFPSDTTQDLDIFLLPGADPDTCLQGAEANLLQQGLPAGQYYVAVDGYAGAAGDFKLISACTVHFPLALYLPVVLR